jgi:hypothetical protein
MKNTLTSRQNETRRGTVLILVLVVVATLTLGAYTFSEMMISEEEATSMYGRQAESRAFAESGLELAAAAIAAPESSNDEFSYNNRERFQAQLMREGETERGQGYFAVVAPVESGTASSAIRFGLMDESGRINLNAIVAFEMGDEDTRNMLLHLPNMTEELADAILDYIDDNTSIREFGVESDYYLDQDPPHAAKDGPLQNIEELLLVAGVTTDLLYGEDANRNGLLDPNEDDGDASMPLDDADGILNPGWAAYLTVHAKELNTRLDGSEKINVNNGVLTDLYDALFDEFDEDVARFVVAFRLNGPYEPLFSDEDSDLIAAIDSATTGATVSDGDAETANAEAVNRATQGIVSDIAEGVANAVAGGGGTVTRDGMDLSKGANHDLVSIYEMIGAQVEIEIDGQLLLLDSPWSANPGDMESYLPDILDRLTTLDESSIPGRINVNQARLETLLGIPNMTESVAVAISQTSMMDDTSPIRATAGWLVSQGIVDIPTMVTLDRFVTGRGQVYRAQVIGYFGEGGGYTRLEATIDATEYPAKILSVSDLTELGRGYTSEQLSGASE